MWKLLSRNRAISIKSGNGTGKSMAMAIAVLWFLESFRPSLVFTTAPTERQIKEILWREIRYWHSMSNTRLEGTPLMLKLDIGIKHFAIGFTTNPESFQQIQGLHSPNIMVAIDEANGYPDELYDPIEGILSGGDRVILLQMGNPLVAEGRFCSSFMDGQTASMTMSCLNHPNVLQKKSIIPGAVSWEWVERQRSLWGEESAFWQSRILGEFPKNVYNTVASLAWIERAELNKPKQMPNDELLMGFDPGEYGNDEYVWFVGTKRRKIEVLTRSNVSPAEGIAITKQLKIRYKIQNNNITVDGIGAGATICSVLSEDGVRVNRFVASECAYDTDTYADRTVEAWFNLRLLLDPKNENYDNYSFAGRVDNIKIDLCSRTFKTELRTGKYMMEPKPLFRKRMKRSCNWGDAMALCYYPLCKRKVHTFSLLPNVIGEY